ncbi:unnamed protein product [Heterosigma akashiwo]
MSLFQPVPMDFESTWQMLEDHLNPILRDIGDGLNSDSWMDLYTAVYKLCSNPTFPKHRELYFRLRDMLINFTCGFCDELQQLLQSSPPSEVFLNKYCTGFERYSIGMKYSADIFSYLDRYWIRENHFDIGENPTEHVYYVWELALHMWREHVYDVINMRVRQSVMDLLENSRRRRQLAPGIADVLRRLMQTYVLLGFENRERSELFRKELEEAMVADAEAHYKGVGADLLQYLGVGAYLAEAEKLIQEEEVRCRACLNRESVRRVRRAVEAALVVHPLDRILEEAKGMLAAEGGPRTADLRRMYALMRDVSEDGIARLQDVVREHIQAEGLKVVKAFNPPTGAVAAGGGQVVAAALGVYWQHHALVKEAFLEAKEFLDVLDQASRVFVNAIDGAPEMLARHAHRFLDKGSGGGGGAPRVAEDERQAALGRAAFLFQFVGDKDVFHKVYARLLAQRLAEGTSVSDEAEELMLGKLKEYAGFEFISGLQRMFIDKSMSEDLNGEYRRWLARAPGAADPAGAALNGGADLAAYSFILTAGCWPVKAKNLNLQLPVLVQEYIGAFTTFYNETYTGRCLKYLFHLGHAEISTRCYGGRYTLVASTYAMLLLLEFNHSDALSLGALCATLQMEPKETARQLFPMLKLKLLSVQGLENPTDHEALKDSDVIRVNPRFHSKRTRIKLPSPPENKKVAQQQNLEIREELIADRKMVTQAAIVRTMKARRAMGHNDLLAEVTRQVAKLYTADVKFVKQQIEDLIDKDYLERREGGGDGYAYVD